MRGSASPWGHIGSRGTPPPVAPSSASLSSCGGPEDLPLCLVSVWLQVKTPSAHPRDRHRVSHGALPPLTGSSFLPLWELPFFPRPSPEGPEPAEKLSQPPPPARLGSWAGGSERAARRTGLGRAGVVHHRAIIMHHCGQIQVKSKAPGQLVKEGGAERGGAAPWGLAASQTK